MIDRVSETYRTDWDSVTKMNVIEFLNVYSYSISKQKLQEVQVNKILKNKKR